MSLCDFHYDRLVKVTTYFFLRLTTNVLHEHKKIGKKSELHKMTYQYHIKSVKSLQWFELKDFLKKTALKLLTDPLGGGCPFEMWKITAYALIKPIMLAPYQMVGLYL
jgi:hypothetical protein